jgi:glycosyltransferase involved in cell wall biosynthesis
MHADHKKRANRQNVSGVVPLLVAVTPAFGCVFFENSIAPLRAAGFEPILVSAPGEQLQRIAQTAGVPYAAIPMVREISPLKDLLALWRFCLLIRRVKPAIVDVGTPKAGLLGGLAALLSGVPCRLYTLRGLRLETTTGWKRRLLTLTERIACACAQQVTCVSYSLRDRAIGLDLVAADKTVVLGNGSCGVDIERFSAKCRNSARRQALADELKICSGAPVIGFVGRLTRDKGIPELIQVFSQLYRKNAALRLLLVGDFEDGDPVPPSIRSQIENHPAIIRTGFVPDTAPYYGLMDVFVFPSHREGFGEVSLEAQASGIPVVTTNATGAIDSVVDGLTGFLVPVGNSELLASRVELLLGDRHLCARMGQAGRNRVVEQFRQEIVATALVQQYGDILRRHGSLRGQMMAPTAYSTTKMS